VIIANLNEKPLNILKISKASKKFGVSQTALPRWIVEFREDPNQTLPPKISNGKSQRVCEQIGLPINSKLQNL